MNTEELRGMNAFQLAGYTSTPDPDNATDSPGAQFLLGVADDVADAFDEGRLDEDSYHEIADSAVPVYTHEIWTTFVDLAAYQMDPAEMGGSESGDMTQMAMVALYMVASELASGLMYDLDESDADSSDGELSDDY